MNWKKITEQVVTVILSMVLTAMGGGVVWGLTTILQQQKRLADQGADIIILKDAAAKASERDKELITLMAEEIKKLQKAVKETCDHAIEHTEEKPTWPIAKPLLPLPPPKKGKKITDKFFPEQKMEEYQRILRDKFEQRTEQMQMKR